MRIFTVFLMLLVSISELKQVVGYKAVYNGMYQMEINNRLKNVETQITFLAIHSYYQNWSSLNSFIAEYCDLRNKLLPQTLGW